MPEFPNFVGGAEIAQSPVWANARTVNWYVEPGNRDTKTPAALLPVPGVSTFATISGATRGRAIFEEDGRCFTVVGDRLDEIAADGTVTGRGTVVEGAAGSAARVAALGDAAQQLALTSGGVGYAFNLVTNALSVVVPANAAQCDTLDGFAFFLDRTDASISSSALYDATSIIGYKQRDARSDPWQAIKVIDTLLYAFGEKSTDIFYNAGASPFPLAQHTAGAFPYGMAAPDSIAVVGDALCWLGRSANGIGQVLAVRGTSVREISTPALRWAIDGYRRRVGIADAVGESLEYLGHSFYVLTFPAAEATWVYDMSVGVWSEWLTWLPAEARYVAWQPHWHAIAFGRSLLLDRTSGRVHGLDPASARDATGEPMRRLRRPPGLFDDNRRVTITDLEVYAETGTAATGVDARLMLNYSKDAGKTWRQATGTESLGLTGEYRRRLSWPRLGTARDWQFEIVCSGDVPVRLQGASISVRAGRRT